jgi:hypothetical protein
MAVNSNENQGPDQGCAGCGNPNCPAAKVSRMPVRVMTDNEGDAYIHAGDVNTVIAALVELQEAANNTILFDSSLPEEDRARVYAMGDIAKDGMEVLAKNVESILSEKDRFIAPPSVNDVPDTLPSDWT